MTSTLKRTQLSYFHGMKAHFEVLVTLSPRSSTHKCGLKHQESDNVPPDFIRG